MTISNLKDDVERLHNCTVTFIRTEHVVERFQNKPIWEGSIHVFTLTGHPIATEAYAWHESYGDGKGRVFTVVNGGDIDSPRMALRASILSDMNDGERSGE